MDKLTFQEFNILCNLNSDKKHVIDCIKVLNDEDCIYQSGIIMSKDHIASLYSLRFDIAQQSGKLSDEYLNDFKYCVASLDSSKSEHLGLTTICSDKGSYLVFYEPDTKVILGILKSENSLNIKSIEENTTEAINKGHSSSAEKYSKGRFIKNWK
jgi:hypothetical protein